MFRLGSLALLAVLLSASTAHAIQLRYGDEEFQSTREESALEEDRGAWIDAAATKNPGEAHRVLVKIRADSGSSCAQDPVAEAGAILIDAVHQPGELPPLGRIDTSEPGTVLACGYEFDAAGTAVIDRRSEPIVISPSVAEISLTVVVTTTHRGVPLRVAASARGGRGRLAHVAAIPDATTCPPAAPSPGAPGVQWLTQPTGIALAERGPLALDPWASLTAAGAFTVCGWVSEPGETPAEAVAGGARITIKPGLVSSRIELTAGLTGRRLTWGAHLFGGFSGRFTLEGVRLRSGRPAGRWRTIATLPVRSLTLDTAEELQPYGSYAFVTTKLRKLTLQRALVPNCRTRREALFVRARYLGSQFSRPAKSRSVRPFIRPC